MMKVKAFGETFGRGVGTLGVRGSQGDFIRPDAFFSYGMKLPMDHCAVPAAVRMTIDNRA